MKKVIIYREPLLHTSETFVAEQAGALRRFHPVYVGLELPARCLAFEGDKIYLTRGQGRASQRRRALYRRIGVAPFFQWEIWKRRPVLVHAHFATDGRSAVRLSRFLRIPLIVTLHGFDVTIEQEFAKLYSHLWRHATLFLCVSDFIRRRAIAAGFPPEKLLVHHTGIDVNKFCLSMAPRTPGLILFVGRFVEKKGCHNLLHAMKIVQSQLPEASLLLVGDGKLKPTLTALAASLDIDCTFAGAQPPASVQELMQKATILCVPSQTAANGDSEGLPTVILEAMACGMPIVSTLHAGIPEAISDKATGLLVPEGNSQALADALLFYLRNPKVATQHALAGHRRVAKDFDLFKQTVVLENIYTSVLNGSAK